MFAGRASLLTELCKQVQRQPSVVAKDRCELQRNQRVREVSRRHKGLEVVERGGGLQ